MSFGENSGDLQGRLQQLERELEKRNQQIARLEKINKELSQRVQDASETPQSASEISEMEEALKRMVVRTPMILQASKCLFLIHDAETNELFAEPPSQGFDDEQIKGFRIPVEGTFAGECFRENKPIILYDVASVGAQAYMNVAKELLGRRRDGR